MKHVSIYTLMLTLILSFTSCNKDDEPSSSIPANAVYDIVTLAESSSDGSTFEMRKRDDSPLIKYTSKIDLAAASKQIEVGDRIIICYRPVNGTVYESGQINLYGYVLLSNTSKTLTEGAASEYSDWANLPKIYLTALWRTGEYINIEAKIYLHEAQKPEKCELVLDTSTADDEYPDLYFVYKNKEGNEGENQYVITTSFDINSLWSKGTCKGINIRYNTAKGLESTTIEKPSQF